MTEFTNKSNPQPPRFSMDEYADFMENALRDVDPARAARQKELEKRIRTPFRIDQLGVETPVGTMVDLGVLAQSKTK